MPPPRPMVKPRVPSGILGSMSMPGAEGALLVWEEAVADDAAVTCLPRGLDAWTGPMGPAMPEGVVTERMHADQMELQGERGRKRIKPSA